jgi:hypothetical protein
MNKQTFSRVPKFDGRKEIIASITLRDGSFASVACKSEAEKQRIHVANRARLCAWLGYATDAVVTTSEMDQELRCLRTTGRRFPE